MNFLTMMLFQLLIDIFMSCPDDIIQDIKYGDQGGTLFMLSKLRETAKCDAKVEVVRLQLIEEERDLASQQVVVDNLNRNNKDGSKRTQLFLANNELWRLEQIAKAYNYEHMIDFDTTKSDGQFKKTADNSKLMNLYGEYKFMNIEEGIKRSVDWFIGNYDICRK